MRRRGESKKTTDVPSSHVITSRRASRRHKSPVTEDDKSDDNVKEQTMRKAPNSEKSHELAGVSIIGRREHGDQVDSSVAEDAERISSEERLNNKRRCSTRHLTPVKEVRSPFKRTRNNRFNSCDLKMKTVPAEVYDNAINSPHTITANTEIFVTANNDNLIDKKYSDDNSQSKNKQTLELVDKLKEDSHNELEKSNQSFIVPILQCVQNTDNSGDSVIKETSEVNQEITDNLQSNLMVESVEDILSTNLNSSKNVDVNAKHEYKENTDEIQVHIRDEMQQSNDSSPKNPFQLGEKIPTDCYEPEEGEVSDQSEKLPIISEENANFIEEIPTNVDTIRNSTNEDVNSSVNLTDQNRIFVGQTVIHQEIKHACEKIDNNEDSCKPTKPTLEATRTRKRRWISRKPVDSKDAVLAISTDSLKTLIAEVHPVPLSDVQLESSSEVEGLANYELEEGEKSPSPEISQQQFFNTSERPDKPLCKTIEEVNNKVYAAVTVASIVPNLTQRSPSPARNQTSNVLYITNLVRPFTLLQLKGLLARTGKITENGFWIDRIKSKCYVEYETEDEAVETRHALHGVRWPVSNPKCLNVDFGLKSDMQKAIDSTKKDGMKFSQDALKDNIVISAGWTRDRSEEGNKASWPMREWDMGKKQNSENEKLSKDSEKRHDRSFERENSHMRDNERNDRDRERRRRERDLRSSSLSPSGKQKKKNSDPPLRLLDDLFRKTKTTPCIYWLPLTPEQIAEKEAFHQKRLQEQKLRLKQRELEREKERNRNIEKDRSERSHRRNRSNERRRSRSRDRRRY